MTRLRAAALLGVVTLALLTASAAAQAQQPGEIPIVCASCGDPIGYGLVASLARPGGNVTGFASLSAELIGKRVELLKDALPKVARVGVILFPANPGTGLTLTALDAASARLGVAFRSAAKALGLTLSPAVVLRADRIVQ